MKIVLMTIIVTFHCITNLRAQETEDLSKWSVGTSLTYPFAEIYIIHINYMLNESHEVFFGPGFQNFKHESFTANAFTLVLGYRYYFLNYLNIEAEIYPAFNNLYSTVTKSYYPGFEMWSEIKIGYRIHFLKNKMYLHPAPGIGFGVFQTNRPPNYDNEIESPIFVPQLIIGLKL